MSRSIRYRQNASFYVDTELFIIKQYEEEINFKILPDEDADDGYYYKFNEKVLFRTDSKTQMEYLRNGVGGMIIKPNEVINGKWGNGSDRTNRLTAAGYDAKVVQNEVNRILR